MSYSQRSPAPRFSIGSLVEIRDVISTRYFGQTGTVVLVRPSRRSPTLDKYVVRFADGVEKLFWDIQLSEIRKSELNQPESIRDETDPHAQRAKIAS
jgi:hypothetical protein